VQQIQKNIHTIPQKNLPIEDHSNAKKEKQRINCILSKIKGALKNGYFIFILFYSLNCNNNK
jgi:hypothetical protein